jgi:uncharacterized protein (TIGR02452 family)
MNKNDLIDIAIDTVQMCKNEFRWMVDDAEVLFYNEGFFEEDQYKKRITGKAPIQVVKETTIEAIIRCKEKTYGVLNFASAKRPGGGFLNGAEAQEESIARCSSLYPVIKNCDFFYKPTDDTYYSDRILYTKSIYVFKDDYGGEVTPPIKCDVITCAAPNYSNKDCNREKHKKVFTTRLIKVIKSAILNNQRNLILGAWGCGVFQNPPDINANIFRIILNMYSDSFDEIIFAIPDSKNYEIFSDIVKNK